jgi:hypothetical protein
MIEISFKEKIIQTISEKEQIIIQCEQEIMELKSIFKNIINN